MITESYIHDKLALVIDNLPQDIESDRNLLELGLDSIKLISLIVLLEEDLGTELDDELLLFDKLNTVNKIKAVLEAAYREVEKHA